MKKLSLLILFAALTCRSFAGVSFVVVSNPCDTNKVLVVNFTTAAPPPYTVLWWGGTYSGGPFSITTHTVTSTTDTLYHYSGAQLLVSIDTSSAGGYSTMFAGVPQPFTFTFAPTGSYCGAGTTAAVTITGGTPPYSYYWFNATYSAPMAIIATTNPATLAPGNYGIIIVDAAGCISTSQDSTYNWPDVLIYNDIVGPPTPDFSQTVTTTSAICPAPGSGTVAVSGGTPPLTIAWENIATGVSFTGSALTASLPAGTYNETTTDAIGCIISQHSTVAYTTDFTGTVTTTDANCTNGTASVAIVGGTVPFSYLWSNGATTDSISDLVTGNYSVVVTDATGCVDSSAIDRSLSGNVAQTITITVHDLVTPATCVDTNGAITAFGSGGTPPYTYLWSNGGTTATISGLHGNYAYYGVTVTDGNGCLGWGGDNVSPSTPIHISYAATSSACTAATGTATINISGGTPPYSINWYTSPPQHTTTATGLPPGNYYFSVTDATGCSQSGEVTVPPADVIIITFTPTPATCLSSNGSVSVSASGGVAPYTYSWSPGSSHTSTLSSVPHGTYYATVTDANGCSATNCQQVPYSSPLVLGLSSTHASCLYTADGTITETAYMGTPPYTYVISPGTSSSGAGSVTVPGLATGSYMVTATDASGCVATEYTAVNYNISDSSCFCEIQGKVFNDLSASCSPTGATGIPNIQLQCSGLGYTYSDDSGYYYFLLPSGSYNISQTVLTKYPLSPCQANNIPVTVTAATGCHITVNFADTLNPIHDMHISTWDYSKPRPGFSYLQTIIVSNNGTVTEPNILASYTSDGQIFSPAFVPSGIFTGAPYYYLTAPSSLSLAPGTGQQFLMSYNVPADIPLGTNVVFADTVSFTPPMNNWLADYSPWDNADNFTTTTIGSYDPNFKEVSPRGTGANGLISAHDSVLEYMVHFQNTGSYTAENVVVKDTLDPNLDWTTLSPVYMSDKCVVDMDDNGRVTFTFKNIDLPDSSDEPVSSNAMFTYTIKQHPNLAIGTQIRNRASIYFDFNAPVMTNTTLNTIGWPEKVPATPAAINSNSFTIYPNPAQNTFNAIVNAAAADNYNLTICDIAGKAQMSRTLSLQKGSQNISVDVSRLSTGIYFVTLNSPGNVVQTLKLVILKQ